MKCTFNSPERIVETEGGKLLISQVGLQLNYIQVMKIIRLTSVNDPLYGEFKKIYKASFPVFEQRTEEQQKQAFANSSYYLECYVENKSLTGFIAYWDFGCYLYIEHFAIHGECRGKGYGSFILKDLKRRRQEMLLLEIDPVEDAISETRFRFYRKNGFIKNSFFHVHPPYQPACQGHELLVLTSDREMTEKEYRKFASDLALFVMQVPDRQRG